MEGHKLNLATLKDKVSSAISSKEKKRSEKSAKKTNSSKKNKNKGNSEEKAEENDNDKDESHENILLREALELGATEDDVKLVEDLDEEVDELSEQEFDDDKNAKELNKRELNEFMKSIGLSNHKVDDVLTDDEDIPELTEGDLSEPESSPIDGKDSSTSDESDDSADSDSAEESSKESEKTNDLNESEASMTLHEAKTETKAKVSDEITNLQTVISDRLTLEPRSDWYNIPLELDASSADRYIKQHEIDELYNKGKSLLEEENKVYDEEFNKSSSQKRFLSQILTGGTLSDKISALTLLVQEAPLHNIRALDNLFHMCQKKSRTAAMQCVDAVVDLLVNTILPANRKLKPFKKQPLSTNLTDKQLMLMYFEDHLKTLYFEFISLLEKLSHDSILYVRMKVVSHIFSLLKAKPEQEANLLRLGVNKLGDIDNKVASKTSYQILLVEQEHPAMKQIICEAVIDVVFRANNDHHALYYSINTLNQTILTKKDEALANKLVDAYFALFEKLLIKTDDQNTGTMKESEHQKEGRRKQKVKRGKKGGKSVKIVKDEKDVVEEKNSKMFAAILSGLNRAFPFSNFPMNIFENHLNVLYKITHSLNFNTSVQALILIQTITAKFSDEKHRDRYYRTLYESLWDERLLTSSKQGIYLNLLYKSLIGDQKAERVLAFVKRISQICLHWLNIGTIAGMIFLLIQLEREIPQIRNLFLNTPMDDELNRKFEQEESLEEPQSTPSTESIDGGLKIYDPKKRDPQFANADKSSLWEIEFFSRHYHPTIQTYAENFLRFDDLSKTERKAINKPDLGLYTLSHFLDRFVYKKSKAKANLKGSSIMQPLGGAHTGNLLVRATGVESNDIPANTEDWLSKKASQIKPEDTFFYQYFSNKQEKLMRSKFDKELNQKTMTDEYEETSDLDEDTVWNALVSSNPNIEGDEDDDLDDELSDLDMSDFSDDEDEDEDDDHEGEELAGTVDDLNSDSENEDQEGLVRLRTIEDIEDEEEVENEEDEDEDEEKMEENYSSEGEDVKLLLEDEGSDVYDSSVDTNEESSTKDKKRRAGMTTDTKNNKRIKLSDLPTFASAEDYAQYLESSDEE
ncbi:hypothetical protein CANINC_004773 [Pichia inconspicua]|uniref:CCAAT-binding factor domain-containing protein n=1 Tax=Pichia inconspicua TaxID=52247 RepID=A0A4V4NF36_9ASCO|nr:hypothetical protein CANINC_004773 [[Candida] inconspicua]